MSDVCAVVMCDCHAVDDIKPSLVDTSYSQSVLPKPYPVKASPSSFDLAMPSSSLPKVASENNAMNFSNVTAAFRPFRSQLSAASGEVVSRLLSPTALPSPSTPQSLNCPAIVPRLSTAAVTSQNVIEAKSTSVSSSNGIAAISTPLVASLMLHPSVSSFQLVSALPAAPLASGSSRAPAPSVQYIVPQLALSDTGSKMIQMVPAGVPAASQSDTLAGFQLTALPRAAIQLGSGPQVLMLCPQQSQAQHAQPQQQQQLFQNSPLSSVVPVVVTPSGSQQFAVSK